MLAWLATGLAALLLPGAAIWQWYHWQRKQVAGRIVNAIRASDNQELSYLLRDRSVTALVREYFGDPAFMIAAQTALIEHLKRCSRFETLSLLLARGADINETGVEWKSALMLGAAEGDSHMCQWLLTCGADPRACDMMGRTAAQLAEQAGHQMLSRVLENAERSYLR